MSSLLLILLVLALVAVNGFFVAAESAIVRSRRSRIESAEEEGSRSARRALHQLDHVDEYVATSQVGITLASIGIGVLGEPAVATPIEPLIEGAGGAGA